MKSKMFLAAVLAAAVAGCSTERYGRLPPVSNGDEQSCAALDAQLAHVAGFLNQAQRRNRWGGDVSVYNVGNTSVRREAVRSGETRRRQLEALREKQNCPQADGLRGTLNL